jgi:myosin protein heavy chain
MQQIHDLQVHLARREEELTTAVTNVETEAATKVTFQRQIREFQTSIQDLQDDMESEKESRKRLEREKRELMEENESLRNELLDRKDINQVMLEREKKREDEVLTLKRSLEQSHGDRESVIGELRIKYTKQIEDLTSHFENTKKQLQTFTKDRQQQQSDLTDRDNEIKKFNIQKQEIERKRRQLETYVQELQHKFNESERLKVESIDKLQRYQQDIESINAAFIETEQRAQNNDRAVIMLRQDLQEVQENLQEENRQKMNVLTKLRQTEDLLNELKDQVDDKEEERLKTESKLIQLTQQNTELRRHVEQVNVEQMEEIRRQLQREKDAILKQLDEEKLINTKLTKSNQKFSNDIADVTVELERYRTIVQNVEKQQRSFDKRIQDEKILQDKLRQERDQNEREIREKETQRLNLLRDLEERNLAYEDLEKRFRQLRAELDDMLSRKDDIGKNIHELERIKRALGKNYLLFYRGSGR